MDNEELVEAWLKKHKLKSNDLTQGLSVVAGPGNWDDETGTWNEHLTRWEFIGDDMMQGEFLVPKNKEKELIKFFRAYEELIDGIDDEQDD